MARTIDLTGKLGIGERPRVTVAEGVELEVDDSARTIVQVIGMMQGHAEPGRALEACALLFGEDGAERLDALGLPISGLVTLLEAAIDLVMGGGEDQGNGETPATT